MKFQYLPLLIAALFVFTKCNNEKASKEVFIALNNGIKLKGDKIESIPSNCYYQIKNIDSTLILLDGCDEKYFHLYSTRNFKNVVSYGRKGNAPNEYFDPEIMAVNEEDNAFWIHDVNHKQLKHHKLKDILDEKTYPSQSMRVDAKLFGAFELTFLDESTLIGADHMNGKGLFFIYDQKLEHKKWINYMPANLNLSPKEKIPFMYSTNLIVDEKKNKIIAAMKYFNRLNIYNPNGVLERSLVFGEKSIVPDFNQKSDKFIPGNIKHYFMDVAQSKNYIYGLFIAHEQQELHDPNNQINSKILVIDWNGDMAKIFQLDRFIYSFAVDENEGSIYGLSADDKGLGTVYRFRFNSIN